MKIFKDKELKEEINGNVLSGGIVEAGETKIVTFYIQNDNLSTLQALSFITKNKEVEILEFPVELSKLEVKPLVIKFIADVNLRQKIEAKLTIKGRELWE